LASASEQAQTASSSDNLNDTLAREASPFVTLIRTPSSRQAAAKAKKNVSTIWIANEERREDLGVMASEEFYRI
jgi:hypothetical protein